MEFTGNREVVFDSGYNKIILDEYINNKGNIKQWEIAEKPDSVSALVENVSNKTFIFVEQYRRPLEYGGNPNGRIMELVAGLVDKTGKTLEQIISEEIREEIGYNANSIQHILSSPKSAGQSTEYSHLFYSTVSGEAQEQILGASEEIEIVEVEKKDIYNLINSKEKQGIVVDSGIKTMLGEYARMRNPKAFMNAFA